jgi:short-subunit dehydrogenase
MRRSLTGLRTIVTGASSGIGWHLALLLAARGANVIALARRRQRLEELAHLGEQRGQTILTIVGDVTKAEDRETALEFAQSQLGGLDCLVNNAGSGALGNFAEASPERLRQMMEINFFAPAEFMREALPLLRRSERALIVNVGSVLGHRAVPGKSEYCASKFAMHGLSDSLRAELAEDRIDVLLISPSTTASEFFTVASGDRDRRPKLGGKAMRPEAVARRIAGAMQTGKHEIILTAGGNFLVWLDRLCPPLADYLVARFG